MKLRSRPLDKNINLVEVLLRVTRQPDNQTTRQPDNQTTRISEATKVSQHISTLKCYQICKDSFSLPRWKKKPESLFECRVEELRLGVFENLGAGYYSFDFSHKCRFYNQARANTGSIIALILGSEDQALVWDKEVSVLKEELLPALSALIRKIEKRAK